MLIRIFSWNIPFAMMAWLNSHFRLRLSLISVGLLLVTGSLGCSRQPVRFQLNLEGTTGSKVTDPERQQLTDWLDGLFGQPDRPFVSPLTGLDYDKIALASGPVGEARELVVTQDQQVYTGQVTSESDTELVFLDAELGEQRIATDQVSARLEQRGLYRQHCVHCHGVTGDGQGPTAKLLDPYPRDFRPGEFKFISTTVKHPSSADLKRVLHEGVPGTSMPSFALLAEEELDALVEYVRYLSIRGMSELAYRNPIAQEDIRLMVAEDTYDNPDVDLRDIFEILDPELAEEVEDEDQLIDPIVDDWNADPPVLKLRNHARAWWTYQMTVPTVSDVVKKWKAADQPGNTLAIPPRPQLSVAQSAAHGKLLYAQKGCVTCHGPEGRGGLANSNFDIWNKGKKEHPELYVLPIQDMPARNLRRGIFRGGRRPEDLYWRLALGILPSNMPAHKRQLSSEELWHLVDYIRLLPHQPSNSEPPEVASTGKPRL